MTNSKLLKKYTQIRRSDREINDEKWIQTFLMNSSYGVLATVYQGQPFAHVNIFAYDPEKQVIYLHNAEHGRTPDNISIDERICFTASEMGRLLPAKTAQNFSVEYSSVVVFGIAEIVSDQDEIFHGLQLLLDKYFPQLEAGKDYNALDQSQIDGTIVIRINIQEWSAKQKKAPPDFPGAFRFRNFDSENPI